MTMPKIGRTTATVEIEPTRARETPRPVLSFQTILKGGANVLLAGTQAAATVVGGPLLSAAVARARTGADAAFAAVGASNASVTAPPASEADALRAMQQERVNEDLKLIALQSEIQRHDRQISLLSNMLKARHDTAKTAIGNIRS